MRRRREISRPQPVRRGRRWKLEHVSPIEWDKIVLYFQYILDLKLVRRDQRAKWVALAYKITRICPDLA
jgi:hypothetical protein